MCEGLQLSKSIRYIWMISDGNSPVHHSVTINVPYGRHVQKVECSKCCQIKDWFRKTNQKQEEDTL